MLKYLLKNNNVDVFEHLSCCLYEFQYLFDAFTIKTFSYFRTFAQRRCFFGFY